MARGTAGAGIRLPAVIDSLTVEEQAARCRISEDLCVMDKAHFFVRGLIELPIQGSAKTYGIGAWSSLSEKSFTLYWEHFEERERAHLDPMFGWLQNQVPMFPKFDQLKCRVHPRDNGQRPLIELEPTDHPLSLAQRDGIALEKVLEIVRSMPGVRFVAT